MTPNYEVGKIRSKGQRGSDGVVSGQPGGVGGVGGAKCGLVGYHCSVYRQPIYEACFERSYEPAETVTRWSLAGGDSPRGLG